MALIQLSTFAKDFIDAADDSGNIRNNRQALLYINCIDDVINQIGRSKFKAVYPFIGGTAFSHKFNFINPTDSDTAFRLSFIGGGIHSSSGYFTSSALNGYGDTFLVPSIELESNSCHLSCYVSVTGAYAIGADQNITGRRIILTATGNFNDFLTGQYGSGVRGISIKGIIGGSQLSNIGSFLADGRYISNSNAPTTNLPEYSIYVGSINLVGSPAGTKDNTYTFSSIGLGLEKSEAEIFSHQVKYAQGLLGRQ